MQRSRFDLAFFVLPFLLSLLGLLFIYSATGSSSLIFVKKQLFALFLALTFFLFLVQLNYRFYQEIALLLYGIGLGLLLLVLLAGKETAGSQRWIGIGNFVFQPSEFAKVFFLVLLATVFKRCEGEGVPFFFQSLFFLIPYLLAVLLQPDLGTSLVFFLIWITFLLVSSLSSKTLAFLFLLFLSLSPFVFRSLKGYQKARILVFLNPQADPLGTGYHLIQSKIAVGSGGILGKGFFRGSQSQLKFVPGIHTDFIFSLICEELGFFGALALLTIFFLFFLSILRLSALTQDLFGKGLCLTIFAFFFFQFFVNTGMTLGLMPVTGIPLPFISYGGSSLITSWLACAILAQISTWKRV